MYLPAHELEVPCTIVMKKRVLNSTFCLVPAVYAFEKDLEMHQAHGTWAYYRISV
jgi:hypothetical protein